MPSSAIGSRYIKSTGRPLELDDSHELARGGEGAVYRVPWDPSSLAKLYFEARSVRSKKLLTMLAKPPVDPMRSSNPPWISIAWPTDVVVDAAGHIRGFLMPFVTGIKPIHAAYHPGLRAKVFPGFDYRFPYFAGANLATAIQALHEKGYVVGDVNENNVQVNYKALVTVIDTDSFQVPNEKGGYHRCRVCVPNYTPPEMQNQDFDSVDRGPMQDAFGLAVLLFQLLMEGNHPYDGVYAGSGEAPTLAQRITLAYFPHAGLRGVPVKPRPLAPFWGHLPPRLQELFRLCFVDGHGNPSKRPSAEIWKLALREAAESLVACTADSRHFFSPHLSSCPWCEFEFRIYRRQPKPPRRTASATVGIQRALPPLPSTPTHRLAAAPRALSPTPPPSAPSGAVAAPPSVPPPFYPGAGHQPGIQHPPMASRLTSQPGSPPQPPTAQNVVPPTPSQPVYVPPSAASIGDGSRPIYCSFCGQTNPLGFKFCIHCGKPGLPTGAAAAPLPPVPVERRRSWRAPVVGISSIVLIALAVLGIYVQRSSTAAMPKTQTGNPVSTPPPSAAPSSPSVQPAVATTQMAENSPEKLLALTHDGVAYNPQSFLEIPEIKAAVENFFANEPTLVAGDGEMKWAEKFRYGLHVPEDGFPKVVENAVVLAGCEPHDCSDFQSFLTYNTATKAVQAAYLRSSLDRRHREALMFQSQEAHGESTIRLYGVDSLESAPSPMQEWVRTRKSDDPVKIEVAK